MAVDKTVLFPLNRRIRALLAALLALLAWAGAALTWPDAPGTRVYESGDAVVDASNTAEGYISVKYNAAEGKIKLRIARGEAEYTYDLKPGEAYEVFPLQMGSGSYDLTVYRQVKGTKYAQEAALSVDVELLDENAAYLCPSQYVWYTEDSLAVEKSDELCESLSTDRERVNAIYTFIVDHMVYNYMRALTVESGYLPNIDEVYRDAMGICFDFSALMTCMLRVQDIPTRMVIGYADENKHAWCEVLLGGEWVHYDPTAAIAGTPVASYTAEKYY